MAFQAIGYCDLNISSSARNLKELVLQALALGYQTVAINTTVEDRPEPIKKRKGNKEKTSSSVPEPTVLQFTAQELKARGITRAPNILTRLTVVFSDPAAAFFKLNKSSIEKYNLLAITPVTVEAFSQACLSLIDVDIISLDPSITNIKLSSKLLGVAISQDVYIELKYSPLIGSGSPTLRRDTIRLSHRLHESCKGRRVFVSSGASDPDPLRAPSDVANLARLLFLSLASAYSSIKLTCHDLVFCARQRRLGVHKCNHVISIDQEVPNKKRKLDTGSD